MNPPALTVACLCAEWCGTCREYRAVFEQLQAAAPEHRYRWIDVEDEAALVGDVDVETFPTLLVASGGHVLFAGPVLPRLNDALRLLQSQTEMLARSGDAEGLAGVPWDQAHAFEALARVLAAP